MSNIVNIPTQHGQKTIEDLFKQHEKSLKKQNFLSTQNMQCDKKEYNLPSQSRFLYSKFGKIFLVNTCYEKKITAKPIANFTVENIKECTLIYNNKSGEKPSRYYIIDMVHANGYIEKDVIIQDNAKSDVKEFQKMLNIRYNGFIINAKDDEFKTFISEFISPKVASKVTIYTNSGIITEQKFLYENALVDKGKVYWADEQGYIATEKPNEFIKAKDRKILPVLPKIDKTGKEVAKEFVENFVDSWQNDIALPMLTIGHMIMAIHNETFAKRFGCPILILFGDTSSGKSTLVNIGLTIFGLRKDALTSGGSTAKSSEFFCSIYNGINVCIDDLGEKIIYSSNFEDLIKGGYNGAPRARAIAYGKDVQYVHICSPLAYSTNKPVPELPEIRNRLNVFNVFAGAFKPEKFKYYEQDFKNSQELSLILPELLKFETGYVIETYQKLFNLLKENVHDTKLRVINNLAYAYTGAVLLLEVAEVEIEDFDSKVIQHAKAIVDNYESIKTPVDRLLEEVAILSKIEVLEETKHFRLVGADKTETGEVHLGFNKGLLLGAINKHYAYDKNRQINESSFLDYAQRHKRFRKNGASIRYNNDSGSKNYSSTVLDITDIEELKFLGALYPKIDVMPADKLRENLKNKDSQTCNTM